MVEVRSAAAAAAVISPVLIFCILFRELHRRLAKRRPYWQRQAFGTGSALGARVVAGRTGFR
jgi:hypothetical protein